MKKIRNNTMAWIVILGLTIVPSLYAWFNIAASWDPYANTGNLKVAVASVDEGYSGELTAINLNIGDKVISSLRENDALDWVFTTEKEAVQGREGRVVLRGTGDSGKFQPRHDELFHAGCAPLGYSLLSE